MEGKRFTILHAGCKDGFLNGCDRDYHKTMTGELFKSSVERQLIPALENMGEKFVVIMDNAPYHCMQVNKPPNMWSTKQIMQEWLMLHTIDFDNTMTKTQLLNLIKPNINHNKRWVIDDILQRQGHTVLRLPPYHCEYNAIELAWSSCKAITIKISIHNLYPRIKSKTYGQKR
jgi:hypothetical protein